MLSTFLASSPLLSPLPFPPPKPPFSFTRHNTTQQTKSTLFSTLLTSTPNSSHTTPSNLPKKTTVQLCSHKEEPNPDFENRNSRLQVQDLVTKIRALPTSQRSRIVDILDSDGGFPTIHEFNNLLMALVTADELDFALRVTSDLSSYRLQPNCCTHCIVIRCYCNKNQPFEAKRVVHHMLENGFQPDAATFTVLVNGFCRGGRLKEALEVVGIMHRVNLEPTIQIYNCLLKGLCYVGKVEKAYDLLMDLKKTPTKPDIHTYTAVMDGFGKVGRTDEASELLDEALEVGLIPNVATFNALFTGYCKEGRPLEGIGLLKRMKDGNCMPDYISYSTLLHGLLKWGQIHEALRIYKEMVEVGFRVDERMMNTLLRGLCRRSRREVELLKDAYQVFERMDNWEFVVYGFTYDLVIEAFCRGRDADSALVNLRKMVGAGYDPKRITSDNVIRALSVEGKVEEALSVLVMCRDRGTAASRVSFNVLIDEFNRQRRQLCAGIVYAAALKLGVIPNRKPGGRLAEIRAPPA